MLPTKKMDRPTDVHGNLLLTANKVGGSFDVKLMIMDDGLYLVELIEVIMSISKKSRSNAWNWWSSLPDPVKARVKNDIKGKYVTFCDFKHY